MRQHSHSCSRTLPLLVFLFMLITSHGFSKCMPHGLYFWPSKPVISQNSMFMIEGAMASQTIITTLGTERAVYLTDGSEKIKLNVVETHVGRFSITQAILKPEKELTMGRKYELVIENLGDSENLMYRTNDSTHQKEKITWTVNRASDNIAPSWSQKPEFKNTSFRMFGCGPSTFAHFSFGATDQSEYLVKTTLKNKTTGAENTYYLWPEENEISVGHGMCSGPFQFDGGTSYAVSFTLCDASGNLAADRTETIQFEKTERQEP